MTYTTLEAVKNWGTFTDDESDDVLSALIITATGVIDNYCQTRFDVETDSDVTFYRYLGMGDETRFTKRKLFFYDWLAAEATSITDSPTVVYLPESGPPYHSIYITDGSWAYPSVTVTGRWGYSTDVPYQVEQACIRLVKWLFDMKDTYSGAEAIVTANGQVLLPQGLPNDITILLAPFRQVTLV